MYKGDSFFGKGILDLKVYQKPINLYLYIAFSSEEPIHVKKGLINTELIRYIRICLSERSFQEIQSFLFVRVRDRGFDAKFLETEFLKISYANRPKYLYEQKN